MRSITRSLQSTAATSPKRIIVFGGNGYIGQNVANRALQLGLEVTSVSRSGQPVSPIEGYEPDWVKQVTWEKGDVLDFSEDVSWRSLLAQQDGVGVGVVSCIGGFGSNEFMEKLNGHANVNIAKLSSEEGVSHFAYVSADGEHVPSFVLRGYFNGKRLADQAVSSYFGGAGVILRPGFVHGVRKVGSLSIPLHWIGSPLEWFLCATGLSKLKVLSAGVPISVQDVAIAAVAGAMGELSAGAGTGIGAGGAVECSHDDMVAIRKRSVPWTH